LSNSYKRIQARDFLQVVTCQTFIWLLVACRAWTEEAAAAPKRLMLREDVIFLPPFLRMVNLPPIITNQKKHDDWDWGIFLLALAT